MSVLGAVKQRGRRHSRSERGNWVGLWTDETGGEKDNLNTLLILALVVLPILGILFAFRKDLIKLLNALFSGTFGEG